VNTRDAARDEPAHKNSSTINSAPAANGDRGDFPVDHVPNPMRELIVPAP
jgi:hypothetical protein